MSRDGEAERDPPGLPCSLPRGSLACSAGHRSLRRSVLRGVPAGHAGGGWARRPHQRSLPSLTLGSASTALLSPTSLTPRFLLPVTDSPRPPHLWPRCHPAPTSSLLPSSLPFLVPHPHEDTGQWLGMQSEGAESEQAQRRRAGRAAVPGALAPASAQPPIATTEGAQGGAGGGTK